MSARGIRNNNPGNIEYGPFARQWGSTGREGKGRFAVFPTPEAGIAAIIGLQQKYEGSGRDTIRERVLRWAPISAENPKKVVDNYIQMVSNSMGIDADTPFSINDPALGPKFVSGMIAKENGYNPYTDDQIVAGHQMGAGKAQGIGAGLSAGNMATRPPGKDPQVAIQQMMLKAAGYDPGPIDGIAGKQTQAALTAYNTAKVMDPTAFTDSDPMTGFQGMVPPASMATTPPDTRAAISPPDDIRAPSVSASVARGPLDADQVVRATIDADPAHLTSAWNDLVTKAMTAPDAVRKAATAFTEGLPVAVKQAAAASFGFNPDLIKSVPAIGWPGKPTVRDTVAASARDQLTFGGANEQLKSLGIGPAAGAARFPSSDVMAGLGLTPQEQHLYQHHLDNLSDGKAVYNPDGSTSTIFQSSVEVDGKTYNIPTVWDGKIVSPHEAFQRAAKQGLGNWPSYPSEDDAAKRYDAMHAGMELDVTPEATGQYSTPTFSQPAYRGSGAASFPAEKPAAAFQGSGAAAFPAPTRDPLQEINSRQAVNMATSQPETTISEGSPFQPALPVTPTDYAMGTIDLGTPAPVAATEPPAAAPVATPARTQAPARAPSMATSQPGGGGIGGRIYRAVSQPITSGMANFWSGPMVQPNFTKGSGGSTMPYQRDTGMFTTNEHGQRVSLGVYTDSQGNQHTFESGL